MESSPRASHSDRPKPWLVKASGRILGPMSFDELVAQIQTRELVPLDEVAQPLGRWRYIRDEPSLARVIEDLRHEAVREDTMTAVSLGGETDSGIVLENDHVLPASQRRRLQLKLIFKRFWPQAVVLGIVVLAIYMQSHVSHLNGQSDGESFEQLLQRGVRAKNSGDFREALNWLKKAQTLRPDGHEIEFQLAPLLIGVDGQYDLARRMLLRLDSEKTQPFEAAQIKTGLGLVALHEARWQEAKAFFVEALRAEPHYYPALANLGVIEYQQGHFAIAEDYFTQALKENAQDGSLVVLLHLSQIESIKKTQKGGENLTEIAHGLSHFVREASDYRQEAQLLAAYVKLLGQTPLSDAMITEILDMDPRLTGDHLHHLLIDRQSLSWQSLLPICQTLQNAHGGPLGETLLAYCYKRAGQIEEANHWIELASKEDSSDPLIRAHRALILQDSGQAHQAQAVLRHSSSTENYQLPHLLAARFCEEQGDVDCAQTQYGKVLALNRTSVSAYAGLARVAAARHQTNRAGQLLQRGLSLSPNYIPLMQLQARLHESKN